MLLYCQKVATFQPPGSLPGVRVPHRAAHSGFVELNFFVFPVQRFHQSAVV